MRKLMYLTPLFLLTLGGTRAATAEEPHLWIYEPNYLGVTFDSDDNHDPFLDFQLSLRFTAPRLNRATAPVSFHLGFTTRLGQYLWTRDSAPVIGKRFNPILFARWHIDHAGDSGGQRSMSADADVYLDVGLAHESNGQSIRNGEQLSAEEAALVAKGDKTSFARDRISRGWDYVDVTFAWKNIKSTNWSAYFYAKHFLEDGPLQGAPEEVDPTFEDTRNDIARRRQVHGFRWLTKWHVDFGEQCFVPRIKTVLTYDTGFQLFGPWRQSFKEHSFRFTATVTVWVFPIMGWVSDGYLSDLAQYNRRVTSFGFGLEFKPFLE